MNTKILGVASWLLLTLALIVDANAASRFWVGGTGTWDAADTTHWAATSGGAGGQTVPGSADTVTFDGSSGGGTVTVNTTVTVQSITMGAFTGTLDFSANNNNVTLSGSGGVSFSGTGSGTRTLNMGNGTWTLTVTATAGNSCNPWNVATTTGLTFNANSSTIVISGSSAGVKNFQGGGLTYNTVTIAANAGGGPTSISGANTFANLNVTGPNLIVISSAATQTITNAFTWAGSSSAPIWVGPSSSLTSGAVGTISVASGAPTMSWAAVSHVTFTGGATFTATNSLDLGGNTGVTITPPSSGGGRIIGG